MIVPNLRLLVLNVLLSDFVRDRAGIDRHLVGSSNLSQQLTSARSHIPAQHGISILRYPHDVVLAVPDRMTAALRVLHSRSVASRSPKGEGFTDPKIGTLK